MKPIALIIAITFCIVFISPDSALAGTTVTVYFAGGIIIGGGVIFFSVFFGGSSRHSWEEKKDEADKNSLAEKYALNEKPSVHTEEDIQQAGMVKILEW